MNDILSEIFRDVRPILNDRMKTLPADEAKKIKKSEIVFNPRTGTARLLDRHGEKLLYSKTECAEILGGISLMSVNRYIKQGLLPSVTLGGRRLVPRQGLQEMIHDRTEYSGRKRRAN